jgi:signal transduction histidine kinase
MDRSSKRWLRATTDELLLEVQDDGRGLTRRPLDTGCDMALRARALNAEFEVESHPGKGSRMLADPA